MVHIASQQDRGFVSPSEAIQGTEEQPSFFVSPRPSDPGDSLTDALSGASMLISLKKRLLLWPKALSKASVSESPGSEGRGERKKEGCSSVP